VTTYQKSD